MIEQRLLLLFLGLSRAKWQTERGKAMLFQKPPRKVRTNIVKASPKLSDAKLKSILPATPGSSGQVPPESREVR
jgi:hypothetical protein